MFARKLVHLSSEPWDLHPLILLGSVAAWNTKDLRWTQARHSQHSTKEYLAAENGRKHLFAGGEEI